MKNASKRIIALLLAVVMIVGVLPFASAANIGPFVDVNENDWFAPYVAYVFEYGLMNGTTKNTFEPNSTCTRAMAATVLYRIEGEPTVTEPATFTDLVDEWYKDPIAWAEDEGVVNGVGDNKFDPSGLVTREQLVTMIWRYAGSPEPASEGGINSFPDAAKVSDYAVKAFNWAIARGIINGKDGELVPAGNATRAEFAKIITVYVTPCAEHVWVDGEIIKAATCTEAGEKELVCANCGEKKTEEVPALGHNYVDGVCANCGDKLAEDSEVVIYYTNDVHTYIDKDLSYDNIADLKTQTEKVAADVLLLDAGDHAQGTAFGGMDKGQTIIELMNAAGYDYATLGNHEFDYGMDGAMNFLKWADFSYLSCNFYEEAEGVRGENVLDSYAIVELAGKKVAIIGITTPESFTKSTPAYFQDENGNYIYGIAGGEDGSALYADVQAAIDAAKAEGAEIVIALAHLGDDPASDPWNSEDVIANTTGLDALIDGHSHSTVEGELVADKEGNDVLLTQTGEYFNAIGKMTIDAEGNISTELITSYTGSDASVKADVDAWIAEVDELLGTVVAKSEIDFIIKDDTGRLIRKQETNLGDFAADALYYLFDNMDMDVDVAIMNGGGIRADMPAGDISYKTTKTVHTFGNVACLQTITGQQLLDALEWGAKNVGTGENGGFLQVSGITYEIHSYIPSTVQADDKGVWCGAPTGEYRVKNVMVGGEPLDVNAKYNLAGYNYTLRDLGDGFAMFDGAVNVLDYVMEDYLVLANYAASFPEATIKADNSVLGANYGDQYGEGRIAIITEAPSTTDYTLTSELKDGDKVVIYNAGSGMAFSSVPTSYYVAGVSVAPVDKVITTEDATIVWDVKKNDDGTYTFTQGENTLMVGVDGIYSNVYFEGDYADTWNLTVCNAANNSYYISSATETTSYGNVYLEWYADKSAFSAYSTGSVSEGAFGFQFYAIGGSTPDPDPTGEYVLSNSLKAGDEVIIVCAAKNVALSATYSGYYNSAVAVTPVDGVIANPAEDIVWTVGKSGDNYTFSYNGQNIGMADSYSSMPLGEVNDKWTLSAGGSANTWFIFNVGRQVYMEYYETNGNWSGYYNNSVAELFEMSFYVKVDDDTCTHEWNEGEVTTEPSCEAKGEKTYTCGKCGDTKTEEIAALSHNYVDGVCANCGAEEGKIAVFEKVTADLGNWEGTYVIGWDDGTNAVIFDGQNDANENHTASALTDNKVTAPTTSAIVIEAVDGGYTLKATGGYLNGTASANDLVFETEPSVATIVWEDGNPIITSAVGTIFRYNNASYSGADPYSWFRFFKPASSVQTPVALYKLTDDVIVPPSCEHMWNEGEVTTEATCEAKGEKTYTCGLCGETKTEAIDALGHNYVDGACENCGKALDTDPVYVAIYNNTNGKVMTDETSVYNSKDQLKAADATLNAEGKLETAATNVPTFKMETNVDGITSFITEDGKYLYCDGTNLRLVDEGGDYTEFYLDEVDGGYYIRLANYLYNGTSAQYIEYYKEVFTCYGITATSDVNIYIFNFYELAETEVPPAECEHVWDNGVTTDPTCTLCGETVYTCTLCGETVTEPIAAIGHDYVDGICSVCGDEEPAPGEEAFVLSETIKAGDEVIIVCAAKNIAFSSDKSASANYYNAGVAVTPVDGIIAEAPEALVWVVGEKDGGYTFSFGGQNIGMAASFSSTNLGEVNDVWVLEASKTEGAFYIKNVGRDVYLEWYESNNYWSGYYNNSVEELFAMNFYVKTANVEVAPPCEHVWDEGEVTTDPDCTTAGEMTYNCTLCDETKTEEIAALGHINEDGDNECDNCGTTLGGDLSEIAFADLSDGDTIMIVMHTAADMTDKDFVLLNNFGTTPANNAAEFTGEHDETMYFTVNITEDGTVTFTAGANNLYCTNKNNGLCCGSTEAGVIGYDETVGYLTILDSGSNLRYIGVYDNNGGDTSKVTTPNFRTYTMKTDGTIANIGGQTLTIYKIG